MKAIKFSRQIIKSTPFKINTCYQFSDKFRDKELAEEKFFFDKEESITISF